MSVYFVQRAEGGPIKIGCSAFVRGRVAQLSRDLKATLVVLAEADGSFREEGRLHRQFAELRLDGEWFQDCPEVRTAVSHIVSTGMLPAPIEEDREVVMEARYLAGETLQAIGNDFGMTRERVRQILRSANVPSLGPKPNARKAEPVTDGEREVDSAYAEGVDSPAEICARYGIDNSRLTAILRRTNTPRYGVGYWLKHSDDAKRSATVVELYAQGICTPEIAKRAGLPSQESVYIYLRRAGIKPSRLKRHLLDAAAVVEEYRAGSTLKAISQRSGAYPQTIRKLIIAKGILRTRAENEALRIAAVQAAAAKRASPSSDRKAA